MEILNNCFQDKQVVYPTHEGEQKYVVMAGVPQGFAHGSLLWNILYDGVLRLLLPNGTILVDFADDIAIVSVAKTVRRNIEENEYRNPKC